MIFQQGQDFENDVNCVLQVNPKTIIIEVFDFEVVSWSLLIHPINFKQWIGYVVFLSVLGNRAEVKASVGY